MRKERINEIWGVIFLLLGLFTFASLLFFHGDDLSFYTSHPVKPVQNYTGIAGAYLSFALFISFGVSAFIIPSLFLLWSGCFFLQKVPEKKFLRFSGLGIALFAMATLVAISVTPSEQMTRGGALGYLAGSHLLRYFGKIGSYIIAASFLLLSLLLATDFLIYPLVRKFFKKTPKWADGLWKNSFALSEEVLSLFAAFRKSSGPTRQNGEVKKQKILKTPAAPVPASFSSAPLKVKKYEPHVLDAAEQLKAEVAAQASQPKPESQRKTKLISKPEPRFEKATGQTEPEEKFENAVVGSKALREGEFRLPPIDLLKRPSEAGKSTDDLQENSRILERTLSEFGISVKVVEVEQGPVITRYELLPAPGVKVNSIASLQDDLALALKAPSVRLIIPIPGKSAVGVEVPNLVSNIVSLREMIDSNVFRSHKAALPLVLGKTTNGDSLIVDLAKMPHILIAGSTGSGKTVCVNSIIMGLLYRFTPDDLKFVMVDPKMVELSVYNNLPHMLSPVVTDVRKAAHTLNWVVNEMENRYRLFATCGVRNIESFNNRPLSEEAKAEIEGKESEAIIPVRLPYIIVVIDELADLMLVARDKVETAILRLAQLARAVGIHLILATQRPSVDVITGVIKANFPARLSFKVSSKVDSRTVLDTGGADKLIGRGDMLLVQPGDAEPVRGQAPLVSDAEINSVVKFLSDQAKPEYRPEIQKLQEGKGSGGSAEEKDELFDEAVRIVLETRQASTSNLQRRLRLGYTRAARIIDQMEAEGLIGPQQGAKPRDILVSTQDVGASQSQETV